MQQEGLTAFTNITREDPLFAAEGLDLESAGHALDALELAVKGLEDVWRGQGIANLLYCLRYPFVQHVHPISFLRSFLESEKLRRRFERIPNLENAKLLISQYKKTVKVLEKDLQNYKKAHLGIRNIESKDTIDSSFYFSEGMVSFNEILGSVDQLLKNVRQLEKDVSFRELLLQGAVSRVPGKKQYVENVLDLEKKDGPKLSESAQFVLSVEEDELYPNRGDFIKEKYGPIYYELSHFDKSPTTHTFYAYVTELRNTKKKKLQLVLADTRFFLSLKESEYDFFESIEVHYGPLIGKVPYWHQQATAPYTVRDIQFYADLATIVDSRRRPHLSTATILHQKSSLLDFLFWNLCDFEYSYLRMQKVKVLHGKKTTPLHYLISRSYPSFYYLPFNGSVWRLPEKIEFKGSRVSTDYSYKTLEEISGNTSKDDLRLAMKSGGIRSRAWKEMLAQNSKN